MSQSEAMPPARGLSSAQSFAFAMTDGPFLRDCDAEEVHAAQRQLGVERAGAIAGGALAQIGRQLVDLGACQLIVADGETAATSPTIVESELRML